MNANPLLMAMRSYAVANGQEPAPMSVEDAEIVIGEWDPESTAELTAREVSAMVTLGAEVLAGRKTPTEVYALSGARRKVAS